MILGPDAEFTIASQRLNGTVTLYAGGQLQTAGGVAANNIAMWDGTSWTPLEAGGMTARGIAL